jgi:hypothetical protein
MQTSEILMDMAKTFEERNGKYGNNYLMVGPIMKILFPNGVPPGLLADPSFHLFELIVVKMTRLAISGLSHKDSAHDAAIYFAMIDSNISRKKEIDDFAKMFDRTDQQYPTQRQKEVK